MAPRPLPRVALRPLALRLASGAVLLLAWYAAARLYPPSILPGPSQVLAEVWAILASGDFLFHMGKTLLRVGVGFAIAFLVSTALGVVMGSWRDAEHFFEVEVLVGLTIPGLAWAMIAMLWFGIRDAAAIFAIVISYVIWSISVQAVGSARTAAVANLIPVVALASAWALLGEAVGPVQILGAAVVLFGVWLAR